MRALFVIAFVFLHASHCAWATLDHKDPPEVQTSGPAAHVQGPDPEDPIKFAGELDAALAAAAKTGLGLTQGVFEDPRPKSDPRSFWGRLIEKILRKDYPSKAGREATESLKQVKKGGEAVKEAVSEAGNTAHGAASQASAQAQAALEMAKEAAAEGGKKSRDTQLPAELHKGTDQLVGSACAAANVARSKAAEAGESLNESLTNSAEAVTDTVKGAAEKGAKTVERQAEELRQWAAEHKQEL